jgi:hypothetical protein
MLATLLLCRSSEEHAAKERDFKTVDELLKANELFCIKRLSVCMYVRLWCRYHDGKTWVSVQDVKHSLHTV